MRLSGISLARKRSERPDATQEERIGVKGVRKNIAVKKGTESGKVCKD